MRMNFQECKFLVTGLVGDFLIIITQFVKEKSLRFFSVYFSTSDILSNVIEFCFTSG